MLTKKGEGTQNILDMHHPRFVQEIIKCQHNFYNFKNISIQFHPEKEQFAYKLFIY